MLQHQILGQTRHQTVIIMIMMIIMIKIDHRDDGGLIVIIMRCKNVDVTDEEIANIPTSS